MDFHRRFIGALLAHKRNWKRTEAHERDCVLYEISM